MHQPMTTFLGNAVARPIYSQDTTLLSTTAACQPRTHRFSLLPVLHDLFSWLRVNCLPLYACAFVLSVRARTYVRWSILRSCDKHCRMNTIEQDKQTESPAAGAVRKMTDSESASLLKQQSSESGTAYASDGETERVVSQLYPVLEIQVFGCVSWATVCLAWLAYK